MARRDDPESWNGASAFPGFLRADALGRHSLHAVSRIAGARERLVALLSYDRRPGACASPLLQQGRYGRVVRPPGEAAAS